VDWAVHLESPLRALRTSSPSRQLIPSRSGVSPSIDDFFLRFMA
jgi:hypothetical protein